nr:hypothetical protein [Rhizobium laguerreae]
MKQKYATNRGRVQPPRANTRSQYPAMASATAASETSFATSAINDLSHRWAVVSVADMPCLFYREVAVRGDGELPCRSRRIERLLGGSLYYLDPPITGTI